MTAEKQTCPERRKWKNNLLWQALRGNKRFLAIGVVAVIGCSLSYLAPMITGFTADYILNGDSSGLNALTERFAQLFSREWYLDRLWIPGLTFVIVTALACFFQYLRGDMEARASEGLARNMREMLYSRLQNLPYDFHKHCSTGDIVQRCSSDVYTVRRFVGVQMLEMIRTVVMVAAGLCIMIPIDLRMALISVVLMPFLLLISVIFYRRVKKLFTESDEAEGRISTFLHENFAGVRVVRAFGQQRNEIDRFTEINGDYRDKAYRLSRTLGIFWGSTDALGYAQIFLTLAFGVYFCVNGSFTVGNLICFVSYVNMLVWPVRQLGRVLTDFGKATVSLERLNEIMREEEEKEPGLSLKPEILGGVEFRDVTFGYDFADEVLKGVSFRVQPGQTVAILGSTGSGKSSLVQLLQRLYPISGGALLIDGVNINDIERSHLRRNIGIVLQEPFLYSRSIAENIRIVRPDASDEELREAARVAAVDQVIGEFEKGYDTIVGEKGVTLSGGQRQRIAIARMLMQNTPILIFDDSMSAVDTETDAAIREALRTRRKGITTFLISHRIATLREADFIIVLENGCITEQGTHDELIRREGLYADIAKIQLGEEAVC